MRALHHPADMTKPGEIAELVPTAEREFGAVDILVNNAGIQHVAPVDEFPVDKWDAIIAINLSSAFHATRAALPGMKKRGWGRVINIASIHGLVASPYKSAYVAAKHGVVGFTKSVALEVAELGHHGQRDLPGLRVDAHRREADSTTRSRVHGIPKEKVISRHHAGAAADEAVHQDRGRGGGRAEPRRRPPRRRSTAPPSSIDGGWTAR